MGLLAHRLLQHLIKVCCVWPGNISILRSEIWKFRYTDVVILQDMMFSLGTFVVWFLGTMLTKKFPLGSTYISFISSLFLSNVPFLSSVFDSAMHPFFTFIMALAVKIKLSPLSCLVSIFLCRYWRYSINEHGTEDIPAMIEKIHEVKTSELKLSQPDMEEETSSDQPYKLCAVCHSLGGAAMLMYVVTQRIQEKPHRLSRLVLLSPAGFHDDSTLVFTVVERLFFLLAPLLEPLFPGLYIPTRFCRMLLNKLARDFHNYPAVGGLVQTLMSYGVGGDSSNWVGVLSLPHYNMNDMPGVSFHVALHLAQMKRSGRFRMYDYGSVSANMEMYGSAAPLDIADHFEFIDIPVDLVAGRKDKVIRPSMVRKHYKLMKESGVNVSYNEFEYAHLDFTFSHREELLAYVMSRLMLVEPTATRQRSQRKAPRLKRKGQVKSCSNIEETTTGD